MATIPPSPTISSLSPAYTPVGDDIKPQSSDVFSSVSGALGRSLTRALALYFARPVRLFRPSKVTGWMTLQSAAARHNTSLSPQYLTLLIKTEGWKVIPRHFLPPLIVNSALGAILFETFTLSNRRLHKFYPETPTVVLASASGAIAGALHAFAGAPADNVRLVLERGLNGSRNSSIQGHSGWRQAWMEVFRQIDHVDKPRLEGKQIIAGVGAKSRKEAREFRAWIKEVKGMSRGWDGVWWGVGKDAVGFAIFFAIFDISRNLANRTAAYLDPSICLTPVPKQAAPAVQSSEPFHLKPDEDDEYEASNTMLPASKVTKARVGHGIVLVGGGVVAGLCYELAARPFDNARRIVHEQRLHAEAKSSHRPLPATAPVKDPSSFRPIMRIVIAHIKEHGIMSLLQNTAAATSTDVGRSPGYRRAVIALRTLGRLGPWGVGFLMWEGFAPSD
ncbi:hypothetical protein M407DRAFT_233550 [Tulasnella calospora MUT 4182]|uniref:Mitochondrial carrier protein n=1 Tax=Tulasnella calospora MUT 4182 TaxID=1051891 RepID=A0A0C3M0C7_9AGAM|nr:hypothetical protein M407DRAFT_233550 [Tulasnella calospora MUT 4182]